MAEQMKPSGIAWIGDIPESWRIERFRNYFEFGKGLNITKENLIDEGIPVISYGQIHSKFNTGTGVNESLVRFVDENYLRSSKNSLVKFNDFIFADTSEDLEGVGNCVFVDSQEMMFAGYHSIIAKPVLKNVGSKYFAYLFLTDHWRSQLRSKVSGVKVYSITQKLLRETNIIVVPKEEQTLIADFLDKQCAKIDGITADLEKQIDLLEKYQKSLITETVTKGLNKNAPMKDSDIEWIGEIPKHWELKKIKYISSVHSSKRIFQEEYTDTGIPFFRTKEIAELANNKEISLELFISNKRFAQLKYNGVQKNDILVTSIGTIGEVWISDGRDFYYKDGNITQIDSNNKFSSYFLKYELKSSLFLDAIKFYESTTTISALTIEKIREIYLPMPKSIKEQTQIADFLDKKCAEIDAIIETKKQQLELMKKHKQSMIYEYITGKKRVTEVQS